MPRHSCFAVGSHGCIKQKEDRKHFVDGLEQVIKRLKPKRIVVYGAAPASIFGKYRDQGIDILHFDSDFAVSRGKG